MTAPVCLGRFELIRAIGRGAASEVFLARDPLLERTVAVKVIRLDGPAVADPVDARRRFLREARITARLSHPHVVVLHEFGEEDGALFLAMEYVGGGTLGQRLQRAEPFPVADRVLLLAEVAEALAYAHGAGVLHRDLKPANVLLAAPDFAKVSDFGIGKIVGAESDLTASGEMIGSPAYMSPEQMRGEPLDAKSDLFSFGILLYQVLAGRRPFPADTLTGLVRQVQHEEPEDPRSFVPELPEALCALTLRCLAKEPSARPQTADEIGRSLRRLLPELATVPLSSSVHLLRGSLAKEFTPPTVGTARSPRRDAGDLVEAVEAAETSATKVGKKGVPRSRTLVAVAAIAVIGLFAAGMTAYWARAGRASRNGAADRAAGGPRALAPVSAQASGAAPSPRTAAAAPTTESATPAPPRRPTPVITPLPPHSKFVRLEARSGVRLRISPDQARVYQNGEFLGIADDWDGRGGGALLTYATPGRRILRVTSPGRSDLLVEVWVRPGASNDIAELKETLLAGEPGGSTGPAGRLDHPDYRTHDGIRLAIRNADAVVYVDGRPEGLASRYREKELRLKAPAVHDVTIRAGTKSASVRVLAASSVAETATVDEYLK